MKAMVLEECQPVAEGPLVEREVPKPEVRQGEVLVRVEACGVCHTDLHTVEGELGTECVPVIPGHEVIGTAEAAGEDVSRFAVGDRVGMAWLHATCGTCEYCQRGDENLCPDARFTGLDTDGGYAEFTRVGEAFAYRVPAGLDPVAAAPLMCAGIIGYRALRLSGIEKGGRLGLYGFGASAHIAIQVARHWGCGVYVFTRSEAHKVHARELGACWTGEAQDRPPEKLHAAIHFAPVGWIVPHALEALDRGGTLALAGIYMTDVPPLNYERHLYYEKTLRSVTASTRCDGEELLRLAADIPI
ncbi:MAG: zinc-dependent alcohol dehydrogenase family protein, partial [Planctomycetota bacterium]